MKYFIFLFAVASVVFGAPSRDYDVKTIKRNRGNNVRLVCNHGLCTLKPVQDSSSQETPVENEEPSLTTMQAEETPKKEDETIDLPETAPFEHSTEIIDFKTIEDGRGDQSVNDEDVPMIVTHEENTVTEQTAGEGEEHHSEENHSDEHHESDEQHQDGSVNYLPMIAEKHPNIPDHDESSEESHNEHEDHTLSTELKPPHQESVWNVPPVSSEEDRSVIYKIPYDDRKYTKGGVKGVKTFI